MEQEMHDRSHAITVGYEEIPFSDLPGIGGGEGAASFSYHSSSSSQVALLPLHASSRCLLDTWIRFFTGCPLLRTGIMMLFLLLLAEGDAHTQTHVRLESRRRTAEKVI